MFRKIFLAFYCFTPVAIVAQGTFKMLVLAKRTVVMPGANQFPVPMKMLAQGIYELKVDYGFGKMKTFKLVKQ